MQPVFTVAIVGAGFSGIAVAIQLLERLETPARICLINRNHRFGRGLAYGTRSGSHLLNVPAGRMGADAEDEGGFVRFLQQQGLACKPGDFVPRKLYGDYLEAALESAQADARPGVRLELVQAEVVSLSEVEGRCVLATSDGRELQADEVVLALGNFTPTPPATVRGEWRGPGVINDPWGAAAFDGVPSDASLLLAGTGLTAFDVVLSLLDRGHRGPITLLSRRGLLPQPHRALENPPAAGLVPGDVLTGEQSVRGMLRQVRALVRAAQAAGHDWRDVVGGLRPHTPRLWQQLDVRGRRQFVRHMLPYWDTHRHRAAPSIHRRMQDAIESGAVRVLAGRLQSVEAAGPGDVRVCWRPRNGTNPVTARFGAVVNCTGPSGDVRRVADGLLAQLRAEGALRIDELALGIDVDPHYRVLRANGVPHSRLRYVGPLLKAQRWEATAVPELRAHARRLVNEVLGDAMD